MYASPRCLIQLDKQEQLSQFPLKKNLCAIYLLMQIPLCTPLSQLTPHFSYVLEQNSLEEDFLSPILLLRFPVDPLCNKLLLFQLAVTATFINPIAVSPDVSFPYQGLHCLCMELPTWLSGTPALLTIPQSPHCFPLE